MDNKITFLPEKLLVVKIDDVRPNTWNPKDLDTDEFKKVVDSLKTYGQRLPIVVRENEGYEIVDGEQRWRACKELGFEKVIIYNEGTLPDDKAKELTLWYQVQVKFNEVKLATMVVELISNFPQSTVPFSAEQLEDMKALTKFDWEKYKVETTPPTDEMPTMKTLVVPMTEEQYEVVQNAMSEVKKEAEETELSDGRILELICGDYLSGINLKEDKEE